jgi:hypothetical protein
VKRIAIILILFQLIGCTQQPAITTNQNEINRLKAEIKKERSRLEAKIEAIKQERERYESEIFWNRVGAVIGVIAIIGMGVLAINNYN